MIKPARDLVLATRKSPLAMAQARMACALMESSLPGTAVRIERMSTTGDRRQEWSLEKEGGKGLFTKELEDALLDSRADFAVHSAKDLPSDMPDGLAIAGYLPRERCEDVLVLKQGVETPGLIATGSPRRRVQLRYLFPGASFAEIRGNVDTRLNKIARGDADATVLASAGLSRLGIESWPGLEFRELTLDQCVPAVGQAAVAIQCRREDLERYGPLLDSETAVAVNLERLFLEALGGGCQVAFAVNYVGGVLRIYHKQCGLERRSLPLEYVERHAGELAEKLIEQLELRDG